jgi:RpiR family carbohydrate utilization transcriptional regulator
MLLDSIRTHINSLSKSEKKVAATILANPQLALAENLTALAKNAEVSEPTVIRFCRAIGYEGWHDFKLKLAQSLALALPGADERWPRTTWRPIWSTRSAAAPSTPCWTCATT